MPRKGTVYLGQHSKRWAFKFYNKWREMLAKGKTHVLPDYLQNEGLEEFIQGKLRAELRIFAKELEKHGITYGYHLTPELLNNLFTTYLGKINMSAQVTVHDEQLFKMPRTLQGTFQLWRQGADVKYLMNIQTFYRHRRSLLEYGVDIAHVQESPEKNNVIPMRDLQNPLKRAELVA